MMGGVVGVLEENMMEILKEIPKKIKDDTVRLLFDNKEY